MHLLVIGRVTGQYHVGDHVGSPSPIAWVAMLCGACCVGSHSTGLHHCAGSHAVGWRAEAEVAPPYLSGESGS